MRKLKNEFIYFATAIMFFTRLPIPFKLPYSDQIMNRSQKYYAWVGLLVGLINAVVFYIGSLLFSNEIAIILSICISVLLTGAFHEDGFTDVCDSFGGGYGKEKIMTIMKDSRIGAYGVIGILLLVLLKVFSLIHLASIDIHLILFAMIAAHSSSRFISGTMIYTHRYVTDIDQSKSKPMANRALPIGNLVIGLLAVLIPFILFGQFQYVLVLPFAYLGKMYLGWYFNKHIGGYTGDCLGTVQQVTEVLIYLGFILVWKFI